MLSSTASALRMRTAAASSSSCARVLPASPCSESTMATCALGVRRMSADSASTPPPGGKAATTGTASRNRTAAAPTPDRVKSSSEPRRRSSTRARPSMASARSITRSCDISLVKKTAEMPCCAIRSAIARASALLPLCTSPPSTTRSPRRTPPPSHLSMLGKPVAYASRPWSPSAALSTRRITRARGEISVGRDTPASATGAGHWQIIRM